MAYSGPPSTPSDELRAAAIAERALRGYADPSCEGVRLDRLASEVMLS